MSILTAIRWLRERFTEKADGSNTKCIPLAGETEDAFMSRCMHQQKKVKGKGQKQAVAVCMSVWRRAQTK